MLTLSFLFEENGELKDEFRKYPKPSGETDPDLLEHRLVLWEDFNMHLVPDWEKVQHYLDTHQQS